jgi:tRNA pseudouridine55 synthase
VTSSNPVDGLFLIDKPGGMTSHDVVSVVRRTIGQRGVGHAGTLDPMATGLLLVLVGKATRLSSLLTGHDKTYDAVITLGRATTTDDADGEQVGEWMPPPAEDVVRAALEQFTGTYPQTPPAHSAKKIDGQRAYRLARQNRPVLPRPVEVTVRSLTWQAWDAGRLTVRLTVSSGFYVRSLARDLGERLGCGGHLSGLRRIASGPFRVEDALPLDRLADGTALERALIRPADALPDLDAVQLTVDGLRRIRHGNPVGAAHILGGLPPVQTATVRVLADGALVALARRRQDLLHPVAVLG